MNRAESFADWAISWRDRDYPKARRATGLCREGMSQRSITCGAQLPDGSTCKEAATVTKTQYVYDRKPLVGSDPDYSLRAIHYTAVCPHCGERKIIEADRKVE